MPERRVSARPRRRRDAAATREAILEAATRRFATQGYARAGGGEIAADVGVTAALVNRYFGSKEGLFAEVIERALDMGHLLQGRRGDLADHLARILVYGREGAPDQVPASLLLLLHSATEPRAVELFRRDLNRTALPLLAEQIGGDDAAIRAVMVMAQLTGFAIMHHVLRPEASADARGEELVALLSRSLAACIG
ncbi:MAG TPA: TetR family transcriptional regulator [Isosphaeraceae bacterium]|nr:TetR family transcriptional regulator [Isosphaeraceae bacterium]